MDTYIIHIYRRSKNSPEQIIGISEHVETGEKNRFENLHQLGGFIINQKFKRKKQKKPNSPSRNGMV